MSNTEGRAFQERFSLQGCGSSSAWSWLLPGPTTLQSSPKPVLGPGAPQQDGTAAPGEPVLGCSSCSETARGRAGWTLRALSHRSLETSAGFSLP